MKKLLKAILALVAVVVLAGCSNVTQKYADKVNEAADANEHYTVAQVREDLGDEAVEVLILNNGFIYAVKGCKTWDEIEAKLDAGEKVEGLTIVILGGKAISASYGAVEEEE